MEFINNIVTLKGEKDSISELKSFLGKYIHNESIEDDIVKYVDFNQNIKSIYDKTVLDSIQNYESSSVWFYYDWCEVGSIFFNEVLEYETLYFNTSWDSSLNMIVQISKLFPDIEFCLNWQPKSIMYECFGFAKIKEGEILELNVNTPQWYLDEMKALCEEVPTSQKANCYPVQYINENGEFDYLPF